MSLKDDLVLRIEKVAGRLTPYLDESWRDVQARLDRINQSLADQAIPAERKARVSELALRNKGERAGQKSAVVRAFPGTRKTGSSS